jgi:hypothetical protein
VRILRSLLCVVALLSIACARHRGGAPEDERDEFLHQLTPEDWEESMARDYPLCELGPDVAVDSWRPWPLAFIETTLRLPEAFRADDRPRDGARASWSRSDSSYVEVMGIEALGGLAVAGAEPQPEPRCAIRVLGRRAPVDRLRFVRAALAETTHFAWVTTVTRRGEGLAVGVLARTPAARDSLLRAIAAIAPTTRERGHR